MVSLDTGDKDSQKDIREVAKLITEHGVTKSNKELTLKLSKISEMSIMLTVQTTAALVGFHLTTPSSLTKVLLIVVLVVQLVAYLCGLTSMLLDHWNPALLKLLHTLDLHLLP